MVWVITPHETFTQLHGRHEHVERAKAHARELALKQANLCGVLHPFQVIRTTGLGWAMIVTILYDSLKDEGVVDVHSAMNMGDEHGAYRQRG